jgi:glycine/D-amino acid oxidase-like deaminating enzyme
MKRAAPVLIVGQGLAGTALAWSLWWRGVPFVVVDRDEAGTCSKVAAGLVTPITGMRLSLNWRFAELRQVALRFYEQVAQSLGCRVYFPLDQVRLFRDEAAAALFRRRLEREPDLAQWVEAVDWRPGAPELLDADLYQWPQGGFLQKGGGYLDCALYLAESRAFFQRQGCWQAAELGAGDLSFGETGAVIWRGQTFAGLWLSVGWEAERWWWLGELPFQSARGSIVTARAAGLEAETRVINSSGCWLLPRHDGTLRLGPTYEREFDRSQPTTPDPARLEQLRQRLQAVVKPEIEWQQVDTAVRPIVKGKKLLLGRLPAHPCVGLMNGLGSKGALRAPWAAQHWLTHWLDGAALDPEVDLAELRA